MVVFTLEVDLTEPSISEWNPKAPAFTLIVFLILFFLQFPFRSRPSMLMKSPTRY